MAITGNQIGKELCDALGLPKGTIGFTLHVHTGDIVTIDCKYQPDLKVQDVAAALTQFELSRKPDVNAEALARLDAHNME